MRYILTIILIVIFKLSVIGQSGQFEIEEILIADSTRFRKVNDFERKDSAFFQDESYYVRTTCSGEWGGSIWFKNKKTGIEYSCASTCPVIINKFENKYIVTNSLAHMAGSSEVIEIENPKLMEKFQLPKPRKEKRKTVYRYAGDDESKSRLGIKVLIDTVGAMILITFPFERQLLHIVRRSKTLYLSQIKNGKLVVIDTISRGLDNFYKKVDGITSGYSTDGFITRDDHHVVLFENNGLVGYLDIFENKIQLVRYQ